MSISRRRFVLSGLAAALASSVLSPAARARRRKKARSAAPAVRGTRVAPALAASANAHPAALERALAILAEGGDTLDAVVAGVNLVEDDPTDMSVGLGGLPNEDGVVELDASCMHGPTQNAGAVAALRNVRNASSVARDVLWHTDHVMLVGEGALRFARARGYEEEDLLTDAARRRWLQWKSRLSDRDDWLEPWEKRPELDPDRQQERETGTINFNACSVGGEVSGVTSTSGLAFKIPGRVGDSPIIGAGLYVHGSVGSAGATGRGEAAIISGGSQAVVMEMASGKHPTDACLTAVHRVLEMNRMPYLWDGEHPKFNVAFYAVDVRGRVGSASVYPGQFAAADTSPPRKTDRAHALEPRR